MFQLEDCIAYITSRGAKTLAERLEDRFTGSGVSRVQWIAMYYVDRCPSITQKQLAERDFNDLLKTTAEGFKPRDIKAVMPFLDVEKLKGSKNQESDIKAALEAVKKDKGYLFQDVGIPRVVAPTPGPGGEKTDDTRTQANNALRSILGRE